jgi:hypothetical protein
MTWTVLTLIAVAKVVGASLPPGLGEDCYQPGELVTRFTVPLIGNATLTVDPSDVSNAQPLPLVIMAIQPGDPWSIALTTANSSIDNFLINAPRDVHYLFLAYDVDGAAVVAVYFIVV